MTTLGISKFQAWSLCDQYGLVLAGAVLATLPVILIFITMQRYFIEGLMAGALKG